MKKLSVGFILTGLLLSLQGVCIAGIGKSGQPEFPGSIKFTENKGQVVDQAGNPLPHVLFTASAPGLELFVTEKGLSYMFFKQDKRFEVDPVTKEQVKRRGFSWNMVDLNLQGADISKKNIEVSGRVPGHHNYFLPAFPNGLYEVLTYEKLTIRNIYPGIDWVLYNHHENGFKYDFVVHKGANPEQIRMQYVSSFSHAIRSAGDIGIVTDLGTIVEQAPVTFLKSTGEKVPSSFRLLQETREGNLTKTTFGIDVGGQRDEDLIIDPVLTWSTFYGGNSLDGTMSIETDKYGNLFSAGYAGGTNMPLLNSGGYFQGAASSIWTYQFILKFSPAGVFLWGTVYGGMGTYTTANPNHGSAIAVDKFGNVFMTGITSTNSYPTQNNATFFQNSNAGLNDATIVKFDNNGNRLWATYFGGDGNDSGTNICTDTTGNVFLVGTTASTNFPVMNASTYFQGTTTYSNVGYISKFSNNGNLLWSTYYDALNPFDVTCDNNNNLYVHGTAYAPVFNLLNPGGSAYFQGTATNAEAALLKFNNSGLLLWSTFLGGSSQDQGRSVVSDQAGNVFVAGITASSNFPTLSPAGSYLQATLGSSLATAADIYICKFSAAGALVWSTYYGGNSFDEMSTFDNLAVDQCGNLYLAFETKSSNLGCQVSCDGGYIDSLFDHIGQGNFPPGDIFLVRFSNAGQRQWATYIGGNGTDIRSPVAIDHLGNLVLSGEWSLSGTQVNNYPTVNAGGNSFFDNTPNGTDDSFFMKFSAAVSQSLAYGGPYCQTSAPVSYSGSLISGGTFSSAPGLSIHPVSGMIYPGSSLPGTYTVSYVAGFTSCVCAGAPSSLSVISATLDIFAEPVISLLAPDTICYGASAMLQAMGAGQYSWSTGATGAQISLSPQSTTTISVSGIDSQGCPAAPVFHTLTVLSLPVVSVAGNTQVCAGASPQQYTASGAASYSWNTGALTQVVSLAPSSTSVFVVTGADSFGCFSSAHLTITVLPLPVLTLHGDNIICPGGQANRSVSGAQTYTWSNGLQAAAVVLNPTVTTGYTVTGTGSNGCSAQLTFSVNVAKCSSVDEWVKGGRLRIFPNPSAGRVWLESDFPLNLQLISMHGQLVGEVKLQAENGNKAQLNGLAAGVYLLRVAGESQESGFKLIVE